MEVKKYTRSKTVLKTVEVKEEVPYIGVHLTPGEAKQLHEWLSSNLSPYPTGMNKVARQVAEGIKQELKP